MAVVTIYGTGYKAPTSLAAIDAVFAAGNVKSLVSLCAVGSADSIASKYYFGKIPSNSIILPSSMLGCTAITSATDFDLGFLNDTDSIVDGQTLATALPGTALHSAGSGGYFATMVNRAKKAWQIAQYTSDPGGELDVVGTFNAAATVAGSILLTLIYTKRM